jgi:hypothetical protein
MTPYEFLIVLCIMTFALTASYLLAPQSEEQDLNRAPTVSQCPPHKWRQDEEKNMRCERCSYRPNLNE